MKLLLTLVAGLALATSAYAAGGGCGGGSCDDKKGGKDKGAETATTSIVIE